MSGRAILDDVVHVADVDPKLHGRGADEPLKRAVLEGILSLDPGLNGQAAVMDADGLAHLAEPRAKNLCRLPGVDEDQTFLRANLIPNPPDMGGQPWLALQLAGQSIIGAVWLWTDHPELCEPLYVRSDYLAHPAAAGKQLGDLLWRANCRG